MILVYLRRTDTPMMSTEISGFGMTAVRGDYSAPDGLGSWSTDPEKPEFVSNSSEFWSRPLQNHGSKGCHIDLEHPLNKK